MPARTGFTAPIMRRLGFAGTAIPTSMALASPSGASPLPTMASAIDSPEVGCTSALMPPFSLSTLAIEEPTVCASVPGCIVAMPSVCACTAPPRQSAAQKANAFIICPSSRSMLCRNRQLRVTGRFHQRQRFQQELRPVVLEALGIREQAPPEPRVRRAVIKAEHVARDGAQRALAMAALVSDHALHHLGARPSRVGQQPRIVVRGAAEHDAIDVLQVLRNLRVRGNAAVDDDLALREVALEPINVVILERRDLAVLLGREALQHGVARVHDVRAATRLRHRADEVTHEAIVLDLVDADAVLHRHRHWHGLADRPHAARDELGLRHQARAEGDALHALARAADVEIDLVIAVTLAQPRAVYQV